MENKDFEALKRGPEGKSAQQKLEGVMPLRGEQMSNQHSKSETLHTEEDMRAELEKYKDYEDVSKKTDGKAAIKLAKEANPQGLVAGVPVGVEYNNYEYKVVLFRVGTIVKKGDLSEIKRSGDEWYAFRGDKIEDNDQEATKDSEAIEKAVEDAFGMRSYEEVENKTPEEEKIAAQLSKKIGKNNDVYGNKYGDTLYVYSKNGTLYRQSKN